MIKAVIFDLDGTLLDRDNSLKKMLLSQYYAITALQKIDFSIYSERFIELDQRGYVWKDIVYQQLINEYQLDITRDELLADYLERFEHHCISFNGMHELLNEIRSKNIKLGVITNGYSEFQRSNIRGLGITDYFDVIIVSEEEQIKKPEMEIFKRALHRLQVTANEAIYVGDHPQKDVEGCITAGMIGIWKEDLYYTKPEVSCHTINELSEVTDIINDLNRNFCTSTNARRLTNPLLQ
ncbi:HAD family hydrolase [Paenibacillus endoradicis]|uniref:HAD family hydrolase n=1 Tax=Paenibacillus endoradicis TaxID=2972487 RepID=UPI002158F533|nr:HAD family hydrolase [Paenibacillus endoradicis]MCR8656640.1 HAD family hydrolase [Paenibacillus endoradicis]